MIPTNNLATEILPQEIMDIIIDEIALQKNDHKTKVMTLVACSLVSRVFYSRCRRHIFSNLHFSLDTSGEKRAARLLKVLSEGQNSDLISNIQSLRFTIPLPPPVYNEPPVPYLVNRLRLDMIYRRMRRTIHNFRKSFAPRRKSLFQLLNTLSAQASLEALAIAGENDSYRWDPRLDAPILRVLSGCSSSLKCLHLVNIWNVPRQVLIFAFTSTNLQELKLANVHFGYVGQAQMTPTDNITLSASIVQTLQMTNVYLPDILYIFRTSFGPSSSGIKPPIFPHLKTLILSFPGPFPYNGGGLVNYISRETPLLEALEFRGNDLDMHSFPQSLHPFYLSALSSLRKVKLAIATSSLTGPNYQRSLEALCLFFSRETSRNGITSIDLEIYAGLGLPREILYPHEVWTALDQVLANPVFVDLKTINFNIKSPPYAKEHPSAVRIRSDAHSLLPRITALPWLEVNMIFEFIDYSPEILTERILP